MKNSAIILLEDGERSKVLRAWDIHHITAASAVNGSILLYQNSKTCPHCGETFSRITDKIPIVNRSDGKTFHLALFSLTYARSDCSDSRYGRQVICHFEYVRSGVGSDNEFVALALLDAIPATPETRHKVEDAADCLAELVKRGNRLERAYTLDKDQLIQGFPE